MINFLLVDDSGVRRKFARGAKFRHNHVTSQINFMGTAEGMTILGWSGGMSLCSLFLLKLLESDFSFLRAEGGHGTVAFPSLR